MPSPAHPRRQLQTRAVTGALGVALALLVGLSLLQATAGQRSADRLRHSTDLVEAYLVLNGAVADQDAIEEAYQDDPGPRLRSAYRLAGRRRDAALATLRTTGDADDRALARQIAATADRYDAGMADLFRAVEANDPGRAEEIDTEQVDPWGGRLGTLTTRSGPVHAADALREVDALRSAQRRLVVLVLVAVPLILVALAGLSLVLRRLRRRLDDARAEELERLERAALTDSLTGIGNHRAFEEMLEREAGAAGTTGRPLALAMFDLDGLKAINDSGGHQAGDRVIRAVADALAQTARAGDGVFRIGGDEYAAVLPGTGADGAVTLVDRVHAVLGDDASVSAGIAAAQEPVAPDRLIARADAALFAAKERGRGTMV